VSAKKKQKSILIIEDEPDILDLLKSILTMVKPPHLTYDIFSATNGQEGIQTARNISPDLILLDLIMPGKDGYQVCTAIKSDPQLSSIPVVLVSAYTGAESAERARQCGAEQLIKKPFDINELTSVVEKYLSK
jgi:CheY-like chemotaxis protein